MAHYVIDNRPGKIDFELSGMVRRTVQNAKNLLMTRMGEVPYDRYRGFDPALFDLPASRLQEKLHEELNRVLLWEPDAKLVSANLILDGAQYTVIEAVIEINITE